MHTPTRDLKLNVIKCNVYSLTVVGAFVKRDPVFYLHPMSAITIQKSEQQQTE